MTKLIFLSSYDIIFHLLKSAIVFRCSTQYFFTTNCFLALKFPAATNCSPSVTSNKKFKVSIAIRQLILLRENRTRGEVFKLKILILLMNGSLQKNSHKSLVVGKMWGNKDKNFPENIKNANIYFNVGKMLAKIINIVLVYRLKANETLI